MSLKKWWRSQKYISYFAAVNYWTRVKMWARIFAILICTSPLLNPQSLEFRSMNLEFCIHFKMQKNVCRKINNFKFRKALICSSFNHMLECLHYKWSPWFQKLRGLHKFYRICSTAATQARKSFCKYSFFCNNSYFP